MRVEAAGPEMNSEHKNESTKPNKIETGRKNATPFLLQRVTTCQVIRREIDTKYIQDVPKLACINTLT